MFYLAGQIFWLLVIAFAAGVVTGWFTTGREDRP